MSELKIIATIVAKPEFDNEIVGILKAVVEGSRKEDGNVSYTLHRDTKNLLKYIIVEVWKSQEAIDYHNNTPHFTTFAKAIEGKIQELQIDVIQEI